MQNPIVFIKNGIGAEDIFSLGIPSVSYVLIRKSAIRLYPAKNHSGCRQVAFPISCWVIPPSTSVVQVSPCFLPSQIRSLLNWHLALSVHWGVWGGLTGPARCLFDWRGFVPYLIGFVSLSDSPTNWLRVETTPDTCSPTNKYLHVAKNQTSPSCVCKNICAKVAKKILLSKCIPVSNNKVLSVG